MADSDFVLTSTAFTDGEAIPTRFTCDGEDLSPELRWAGAPEETQSLALVVDDPDAKGFVHWVAYNMTASRTGGLAEGASASPDAPEEGTNDFRRVGWGGPCPPSGRHQYRFRLLALDQRLELAGAPSGDDLMAAAEGHVIGTAELTGTYQRRGR